MLQVSMGSLISLVIIMLICFVLPFALFYLLYRYADGRAKTFLIGAAAYIVGVVIIDTVISVLLDRIGGMNANAGLYLLFTAVLSPACFILVNYYVIKRFGADNMSTTGDAMMYSLGYSVTFNLLSTGIISAMYFLTMLDIRSRADSYVIVSDSEYVSASNAVSASNYVGESVYNEMVRLCGQPVSYYMTFIINCLWIIAAYAALMLVIWLAVKKANKVLLLAFACVMRLFLTLPDIFTHFDVIGNQWISQIISIIILVIVWVTAVYCRMTFIDSEDAVKQS